MGMGMEEVKQHPFFKGIDFKALGKFLAGEKGAGFNPQDYDLASFVDDIGSFQLIFLEQGV